MQGHEENSAIKFNSKFGCTVEEAVQIMDRLSGSGQATDRGPHESDQSMLEFKGFSFHVGSKCRDPSSITTTMEAIMTDLVPVANSMGLSVRSIDIGGGFETVDDVRNLSLHLGPLRDRYPALKDMQLIAEPGRLFAMPSLRLYTKAIGVRCRNSYSGEDAHYMVTLNDTI